MTVESIAKNYVKEVRTALKDVPKEKRAAALDIFLQGFVDAGSEQYTSKKLEDPDLQPLYDKGTYVRINFTRPEVDTATRVIDAEVTKLKEGLSRKSLWEYIFPHVSRR